MMPSAGADAHRRRSPLWRQAARLVVVAGLVLATIPTTAAAANASTATTDTPVRACTDLGDSSCQVAYATIPAGATVDMKCWQDESMYAGTVRWFWVDAPGVGVEGFVSANQVAEQTTVGHCDNLPAIKSVRWAGARLSENVYVDWCLQFVHDAWISGGGKEIDGAYDAITYWKARESQQVRDNTTPPVGALVFWAPDSYNPHGHVAISIGGGRTISTNERTTARVHVMSIAERNREKPYLGYIIP
jgi:cell wall-associated NlpC family hydrolase